jgi:hypothetical protein
MLWLYPLQRQGQLRNPNASLSDAPLMRNILLLHSFVACSNNTGVSESIIVIREEPRKDNVSASNGEWKENVDDDSHPYLRTKSIE